MKNPETMIHDHASEIWTGRCPVCCFEQDRSCAIQDAVYAALRQGRKPEDHFNYYLSPEQHGLFENVLEFRKLVDERYKVMV